MCGLLENKGIEIFTETGLCIGFHKIQLIRPNKIAPTSISLQKQILVFVNKIKMIINKISIIAKVNNVKHSNTNHNCKLELIGMVATTKS
jgi:hypothetical protein